MSANDAPQTDPDGRFHAAVKAFEPELVPGAAGHIARLWARGFRNQEMPRILRGLHERLEGPLGRRFKDPAVKQDPEPATRTAVRRLVAAGLVDPARARDLEATLGPQFGSAGSVLEAVARKVESRRFNEFRVEPIPPPEGERAIAGLITSHFGEEVDEAGAARLAEQLYRRSPDLGRKPVEAIRAVARTLVAAGPLYTRDGGGLKPDDKRLVYTPRRSEAPAPAAATRRNVL